MVETNKRGRVSPLVTRSRSHYDDKRLVLNFVNIKFPARIIRLCKEYARVRWRFFRWRNITRQIDLPSSCQLTRTMVMREKLHENSNPGNWPICDNALIEVGPAWWQCEHSMPNTSALEKYEQLAAFNIAGTVDQEAPVRGTAVS